MVEAYREWDIYATRKTYERYRSQIRQWKTTARNRKLITEFLDRTELEGMGVVTRMKYIYAFKTFLRAVNKDFETVTVKDMQKFLMSMLNYSEKTKKIRWCSMSKFFRYIGKGSMAKKINVRFKTPPIKMPEELLTQEDIKAMIIKASDIRDKAIVALLYESGCRIGEFLSRKVKHITIDAYGAILMIDGKTGRRRVRVVQCTPLIQAWLNSHPNPDPESFLWVKKGTSC